MNRTGILETAQVCICGQREEDYGSPEDNFSVIAAFWEAYIKRKCVGPETIVEVLPEDVAAMMALLKLGRIATGSAQPDSWVDLAGYAALGGELSSGSDPA